ncbi:MAG: hypothetical protein LBF88_12795 [Planctomycetaceae bacterium]|jgi:Ca2+-binding EF-hand superfamily protein|nr:hypothetical protein [Planctomycetaceae bacterium]
MKKIILFFSVLFFCAVLSFFVTAEEPQPSTLPKSLPSQPANSLPSDSLNVMEKEDAAKASVSAENPVVPDAASMMLGGTVPAIWEIKRSMPATDNENIPDLLERNTMAPPVPGKVIRYAMKLMQHYDGNMDGILQEAEWKKLGGAPQAIDLDGDRAITETELIRFIAIYGEGRTIHHPQPVERYFQPKPISSQFQIFKPFSPIPAQPVPADSEKTNVNQKVNINQNVNQTDANQSNVDPVTPDLTEEAMKADETPIDDAVYAEIIANRLMPALRKYNTPLDLLRGVPVWFLLRDLDGDGQVSLKEFAPTLSIPSLRLFGHLDKNGDGFITPDEVRE